MNFLDRFPKTVKCHISRKSNQWAPIPCRRTDRHD